MSTNINLNQPFNSAQEFLDKAQLKYPSVNVAEVTGLAKAKISSRLELEGTRTLSDCKITKAEARILEQIIKNNAEGK